MTNMSSPSVLWGAAGLAAVLPMIRLVLLSQQWVAPRLLNAVLSKTCYEGRWDRALKLCRAQPQMPYCATLDDVLKTVSDLPQEDGVRTIITPLTTVFAESWAVRGQRFFAMRWLSFLAAALLIVPPLQGQDLLRDMPNLRTYFIVLGTAALLIAIAEYVAMRMHGTCTGMGNVLMAQLSNAATRPTAAPPPEKTPSKLQTQPIADKGPSRIVLHVYRGSDFIEEHTFTHETIKIGKLSSSHLGAKEASLSRMHAVIELLGDGSAQIIDLASTAGTFHNGQKVSRVTIHEGDEIGVGELRIVVRKLSSV